MAHTAVPARGPPYTRGVERRRKHPPPAVYRRRRLVAGLLLGAALLAVLAVLGNSDGALRSNLAELEAAGGAGETEEEPVELTVSTSGDLLINSPVFIVAATNAGGSGYDFGPMFAPIRKHIRSADLALCHAETVIGFGEPQGQPLYDAPADLAPAIADTGWDACDTASNHSVDFAQEGVDATIKNLERAGVRQTGTASSARAARKPLIMEVNGAEVALLAYTTDTNGLVPPEPWSVNVYDRETVLADARAAREEGADVVIVNIAWGSELVPEDVSEPSAAQEKEAKALAASPDITALVGAGPHVIQPIAFHEGTPIVYGTGNLISNQTAACCAAASQDGMIVELDVVVDADGDRVDQVRYIPTWVRHPDYAVLPVGEALANGDADEASLRASWERTTSVVGKAPGVKSVPRKLG